MRAEPRWIDKRALPLLHEESLAEFGGPRGLRDEGLLDSALACARNRWVYSEGQAGISELAAAYASGLANNHPCIDGNKRLAFLSIGLFLRLNGYRLIAGKVEAVEVMMALAGGKLSEEELSRWIEAHTKRPRRRGQCT